MRCFFIALMFLIVALGTKAKGRTMMPKPGRQLVPTNHALTGQIGVGWIGGYQDVSAGLEYEQFFTQKKQLSVLVKADWFYGGTTFIGPVHMEGDISSRTSGYYVAPGLLYHPLGNKHRIDLGIALFFPLGRGIRKDDAQYTFYARGTFETINDFFGAYVAEATIKFQQTSNHRLVAAFLNAGNIYSNAHPVYYPNTSFYPRSTGTSRLYLQFGVRFGGRW